MRRQELLADLDRAAIDVSQTVRKRPILLVHSDSQTLQQIDEDDTGARCYAISSSRHGLGQQRDSFCTPAGWHRIAEKIGAGEPEGRIFKSRQPSDRICTPEETAIEKDDVITSRILWLDGLQAGLNQGGEVDSHDRYIYIHGTADEAHIGQPMSIGCIRMTNRDVIELFERVEVGDLVLIT